MTSRPKITIITMGRKPVSEANVTANVKKWKVGGINVDALRISGEERTLRVKLGGPDGPGKNVYGDGLSCASKTLGTTTKGRWPTNVILSHQIDCVCVGVKSIASDSAGVEASGTRDNVYGGKVKNKDRLVGYADAEGNETVLEWRCTPSCPVADVDRQAEAQNNSVKAGTSRYFKQVQEVPDVG